MWYLFIYKENSSISKQGKFLNFFLPIMELNRKVIIFRFLKIYSESNISVRKGRSDNNNYKTSSCFKMTLHKHK